MHPGSGNGPSPGAWHVKARVATIARRGCFAIRPYRTLHRGTSPTQPRVPWGKSLRAAHWQISRTYVYLIIPQESAPQRSGAFLFSLALRCPAQVGRALLDAGVWGKKKRKMRSRRKEVESRPSPRNWTGASPLHPFCLIVIPIDRTWRQSGHSLLSCWKLGTIESSVIRTNTRARTPDSPADLGAVISG